MLPTLARICYTICMTTHQMNLQLEFFDFIKNGTKRIELRLFDAKRQQVQLGDTIEFAKSEQDKVLAKVTGLLRYESFEALLQDFPIEILADRMMTKTELLDALTEFYPPAKQVELGVLGIRFELI